MARAASGRRVTIVLSTLLNPSLLVADEVTSALDVSTQRAVGEMLLEFRDRGFSKSVIAITHDLSLGNYVSDRTVILRRGAIVEMGDTVKVFSNPQHPYTRNLLEAVPELHKKWHADAGEGQAVPVNGTAGVRGNGKADALAKGAGDVSEMTPATPALARHGHSRRLTRAERPPQPVRTLEPPPLTRFEEDHFVAAAES